MTRAGCAFSQKAGAAQRAGGVAALIANDGLPGRTAPISATLFGGGVRIPVLVISSGVGVELPGLAQAGIVLVHLDLSVATTRARAANVIADLPGRQSGVILLGGHLDSVANGPCINDHASFAGVGIPVGGLFTGADDIKSTTSARRFGGSANLPFDACYHKACDTVANVDFRMLGQMADAAAVVAVRLAG